MRAAGDPIQSSAAVLMHYIGRLVLSSQPACKKGCRGVFFRLPGWSSGGPPEVKPAADCMDVLAARGPEFARAGLIPPCATDGRSVRRSRRSGLVLTCRGEAMAATKRRAGNKGTTKRASGGSSRGNSSAGRSRVTTDHEEIRRIVESKGGRPACVRGTEAGGSCLLRIDYVGAGAGEEKLAPMDWDEFFEQFDENGLAMAYDTSPAVRLTKFVSRNSAKARAGTGSKGGGSRSSAGTRGESRDGGRSKAAGRSGGGARGSRSQPGEKQRGRASGKPASSARRGSSSASSSRSKTRR